MDNVLIVILVIVVAAILAFIAMTVATRVALNRRNRVVSGVPSPAPVTWLASERKEAKLHRRLRAVGRRLELIPGKEGTIDLVERLKAEIVNLDSHLVTVSRRPTAARRTDRAEIAERVTEVEDLVRRVEERSRSETVSLAELSQRLDILEAADDEVRGLEPG